MATRRESVILELQDSFSSEMARAAATTALLNRELKSLSGSAVRTSASTKNISRDVDGVAKSARAADASINQLTGRLRLFADLAALLGPSLTPIGAVAIPAVTGLSQQLGFAAIAGGVLIGSMQGLGDALKALNDAHLDPTAENLTKVEDALNGLSPAAADFAREAYDLMPLLRQIRDAGAGQLFPGLTESLDNLERLSPSVLRIFESVGGALGEIAASGTASLASGRWSEFFDFIADEAPRALSEMASAVGSLTHGLAEMWMAFSPLNSDFSQWLMDTAADFDDWAAGLDQTQGFQSFVDYIRETGPQVAETMGALGNAVVQFIQATAPLGGPVLAAIEAVADGFSAIADSDIGTPILTAVAALALLNRTLAVTAALSKTSLTTGMFAGVGTLKSGVGGIAADLRATRGSMLEAGAAAQSLSGRLTGLAKGGAVLGGLAVASSGAADGLGLTNTASLALMGTITGPWGAAIGGGIGLLLDWRAEAERAEAQAAQFRATLETFTGGELEAGLREAQALLFATGGDGMAGQLIAQRIADIETEIGLRRELAEESRQAAAEDAYYNSIVAETRALEANIAAMQAKRDAAIAGFSAETSYASSVLAAKTAIEENGKAWNLTTEAGIKNRQAVEQMAGQWNNLNRNTEQTPAAYKKARQTLIDTAEQMGATKRQAKQYADQLLDIPDSLETKIKLEVDTAIQRAKAIKAELASIDRNIDVYVNVRRPNAGGFGPQVGGSADGGTVPKTGKPYADRHLYLLADGEEVISNRHGQADRHRSLLKAINGGLAEGGTTGRKGGKRKSGAFFYSPDNTDALQAAIDRLTMVQQDQTDALESSTRQQEFWASKMSDLAQATVSGFNTGLFDRDSDVWSAGAGGGPIANLLGDIAGLNERAGLQSQLAGMGLSGDALAALLSQGTNADLTSLIQSGQAGQYASLYAQRAALQGSVGAGANVAAGYTAQAAAAAAESAALRADVQKSNLELVRLNTVMARNTAAIERMEATGPERTGAAVRGAVVQERRDSNARGGRG